MPDLPNETDFGNLRAKTFNADEIYIGGQTFQAAGMSAGFAAQSFAEQNNRPQVIGHRLQIPRQVTASTSTYRQHESRIYMRTGAMDATRIQLGYCNWWDEQSSGTGEAEVANSATLVSALESLSPAFTERARFNGAINASLAAGELLRLTDPFAMTMRANTSYMVQSGYKVAADGLNIPTGYRSYAVPLLDRGYKSVGGSSQVGNVGNWSTPADSGASSDGYGPSLIIGIPKVRMPAVMLFGHSIISGTGDMASGDGYGNIGYAARALGNMDPANVASAQRLIPYTYVSRAGNKLSYEAYAPSFRKRMWMKYHTHVLCDMGINDMLDISPNVAKAYFLALWGEFKAAGLHVTQMLITTKTTGAWTSPDGSDQTIAGEFAPGSNVDQVNDWIKTQVGLGLLDGFLDSRPYIQNMTTNKYLAPGYTTDGTHPTQAVHTAIADGLIRPWATGLKV